MRVVGCPHNLERLILHGASAVAGVQDERGRVVQRLQYVSGDTLTLVCPHGCPDIHIRIKRRERGDNGTL